MTILTGATICTDERYVLDPVHALPAPLTDLEIFYRDQVARLRAALDHRPLPTPYRPRRKADARIIGICAECDRRVKGLADLCGECKEAAARARARREREIWIQAPAGEEGR